eukprot:CAMPEP_0194029308 /NCGR_PEP_ID=MMETSP0009_2-20130614/3069_1 /TAXON_ID=210454 /ORGANISM="Grammatophora oceanica, Strain CCMP 410" /LENGTH=179 /DNA_ID=CAMNT_0038668933 /DNA_START=149 /DNA_END=688 /DNA_ORIENTATION=+
MSTTRSTVSSTKASVASGSGSPKTTADLSDAAYALGTLQDISLEDIMKSRDDIVRNRMPRGPGDPPDDNSTDAMMGSFDGIPGEEDGEENDLLSFGMRRGASLEASNLKAHDDDIERQEKEAGADPKKKRQQSFRHPINDEGINDIGQRRSPIELLFEQKADSTQGLVDDESDYRGDKK